MNRLVELGQLMDWYGAFLTERQRSLVRQYAYEDCSLGEIAEREGISRQAVRDAILTAESELRSMETKLNLIETNEKLRALIDQLDIYFVRQKSPRGLGDALRYAEPFTSGEPFVVLLGDTFTRPSCLPALIEGYRRHRVSTIAVQSVPQEILDRYGVVAGTPCGDGELRITDLVEKPNPRKAPSNLAVLGAYLLTPSIFPALARTRPGKNGEIQLTDALRAAAETGRLVGCISTGRRYDIGEPLSWLLANIELGLTDPNTHRAVRELLTELGIGEGDSRPRDQPVTVR